jgi:hypothetical protein
MPLRPGEFRCETIEGGSEIGIFVPIGRNAVAIIRKAVPTARNVGALTLDAVAIDDEWMLSRLGKMRTQSEKVRFARGKPDPISEQRDCMPGERARNPWRCDRSPGGLDHVREGAITILGGPITFPDGAITIREGTIAFRDGARQVGAARFNF